jgi:hypothetical protein
MVQYQTGRVEIVTKIRKLNPKQLRCTGASVDVKNVSRSKSKCSFLPSFFHSFFHFLVCLKGGS